MAAKLKWKQPLAVNIHYMAHKLKPSFRLFVLAWYTIENFQTFLTNHTNYDSNNHAKLPFAPGKMTNLFRKLINFNQN